jgi:phosphatidate cytidylyltransferase
MTQRILTAALGLLVFLPFVFFGDIYFVLFVYLIATIGLLELLHMKKISRISVPSIFSVLFLWLLLAPNQYFEDKFLTPFSKVEVALLAVLFFLTITVLKKNRFTYDDVGFIVLSTLYIGVGFYYMIDIRQLGLSYLFYALLVIWATDTGAYFVGRSIGKRKLWPEISPNKTIEGSIGGILLALIVGILFQITFPISDSFLAVMIITVLVSIFGQIGDLVESALKRHYQVKDSGTILPGHGGILDRFDSLLFVLPILHFIQFL